MDIISRGRGRGLTYPGSNQSAYKPINIRVCPRSGLVSRRRPIERLSSTSRGLTTLPGCTPDSVSPSNCTRIARDAHRAKAKNESFFSVLFSFFCRKYTGCLQGNTWPNFGTVLFQRINQVYLYKYLVLYSKIYDRINMPFFVFDTL